MEFNESATVEDYVKRSLAGEAMPYPAQVQMPDGTLRNHFWITGIWMYATNDSKLDSVQLAPLRNDVVIKFVPRGGE